MMVVSLYTSRVILNTLGVVDFGINNVVGGVITMLGFLTGSLGAASSRYITFDLGKGDMSVMKRTFGNIKSIHYILAGVILLVGETLGLWFMTTQLQIPAERETAAFWVYQFSILSAMIAVISVPYNATIIAHEKMAAFAYITIVDAVLKLLIVYLLIVIPFDKLIIYSFLFFCIQTFDQIVYLVYCSRHFEEVHAKCSYDKKLFREIFSFAGWTMNGNLAVIGFTQGLNMHGLLIKSSKFSFFILFFIAMPLMFEANIVLKTWLGIVPDHTVNFLRLILIVGLLFTLSNPIIVSVHATGRLKRFQLIEGTMLLMIVPIAYVCLKFLGIRPEYVFVVHILVEICTQYARLRIVLPMINMNLVDYFRRVVKPILFVIVLSPILPYVIYNNLNEGYASFFIECSICVLCSSMVIYSVGCTCSERIFIKGKIFELINKVRNRN